MKYVKLMLIQTFFVNVASAEHVDLHVVTEHWPPYIIQAEQPEGIVTGHVKQILDETNLSYEINLYDWAKSYYLAKSQPNVLIYSIYRSPDREEHFHWFCPIHEPTPIYAFKLADNKANIDTLESLKKHRIGVMRGDNSHEYFLNNGFRNGVNLYVSSTEKANVAKLLSGEIDVVIQSKASLKYRLELLGASDVDVVSGYKPHKTEPIGHCMALSKNTDKAIIDEVSRAFEIWGAK
jgi:polar amino acid transport system substrate-binding protein